MYAEEGIFVLHKNIRWGLSNCVPVNVLFFSGMFQNPTNNYLSQEAFSEGMFVSIAAFGLDLLVEFLTSESGISPGLDVHCQLAEPNTTRSIAGMPSAFSGMLKKTTHKLDERPRINKAWADAANLAPVLAFLSGGK